MRLPERVNHQWMATLENDQLAEAESKLHTQFVKEEQAEKKRAGSKYTMLRGPESLVNAWMRWLTVNNEAQSRGIHVLRTAR